LSLPRFYVDPAQWNPAAPCLTGAEAHHARDVLRLERGGRAVLFNGHGQEITAEVTKVSRDQIEFVAIEEREAPPRACRIALAQAIPKGKNMDLIVQKAVELGAAEIIPIISERTVVSLDKKESTSKQAKWQQIVIEACKQCGQNWMPNVAEPRSLKEFLQAQTSDIRSQRSESEKKSAGRVSSLSDLRPLTSDLCLVASLQPDALHLKEILIRFEAEHEARPTRVTVLIGPEGDLTPAEYGKVSEAGFQPITLGSIILRVETAATYCLSVLSYELLGEEF
jgi:16S rRNA (uracil1498-N3)-methyltransferase